MFNVKFILGLFGLIVRWLEAAQNKHSNAAAALEAARARAAADAAVAERVSGKIKELLS